MENAGSQAIFLHCLPAFHDLKTKIGKEMGERFNLTDMEVTDEVFESAVSIFSREELRYIEETLKEAHDSASMLAVGDNNVIRAYTGGKYTAVITYEDRHIISIQSM